MIRRPGLVLLLVLAPAIAPGAAPEPDPGSSQAPLDVHTALLAGNRHFRGGRLEEAVATYRRGLSGRDVDPVLAYNLGTALHRLGRLPEALLWYRRAQAAGSRDPWLEENLARVRADLGAARRRPPALLAPILLHPWLAQAVAAAFAWAGLLSATVAPPRWRRAALPLLAAALVSWGGALGVRRLGPRPAVLLAACGPDLPAGSELWGVPEPSGDLRVSGRSEICSAEAVATLRSKDG